jgi:hypothetical protein
MSGGKPRPVLTRRSRLIPTPPELARVAPALDHSANGSDKPVLAWAGVDGENLL